LLPLNVLPVPAVLLYDLESCRQSSTAQQHRAEVLVGLRPASSVVLRLLGQAGRQRGLELEHLMRGSCILSCRGVWCAAARAVLHAVSCLVRSAHCGCLQCTTAALLARHSLDNESRTMNAARTGVGLSSELDCQPGITVGLLLLLLLLLL
jgi:hypothetical protein